MPSRWSTIAVLILWGLLVNAAPGSPHVEERWIQAIRNADLAELEALVGAGVPPDLATRHGKTALMVTARRGDIALVRRLIEAGADVDRASYSGGSALMYAAAGGSERTVELLLERGAAVNARGANGWTALTIAAVKGHGGIVRRLLSSGADPNVPDMFQWTPLMRASYEGRAEVVEILLDHHATRTAARSDRGATALHYGALQGDERIVRMLLARGADPRVADEQGRTPEELAQRAGHARVARLLHAAARRGRGR